MSMRNYIEGHSHVTSNVGCMAQKWLGGGCLTAPSTPQPLHAGLPRSGGFFAPNGRWPSEISPGCGAVGANGAAMPAWRPGGGGGGGRPLSGAFTRAWAGQSHYSGGGSSRAGNFAAAEASRTTVWERLTQAGAAAQRAAAEKREAARVAAQTRSVLRPVQ
eukprot:364527-Chlamydomonas_euryale.AAC.12